MQFTQDLGLWAYLLLGLLVMVEGPVATLAGAVAASAGYMQPLGVFASAACANLLSDIIWYTLGYLGRMEWLHRYGGFVGLREELVLRMMRDIQTHAAKILFVAKLTLGFTIPTLVATGLARVPIRRWLYLLVIGETIWTGTLVFMGYRFGQYVSRLERGVEVVALVGALLFVLALLVYLNYARKRTEKKAAQGAGIEADGYIDFTALDAEMNLPDPAHSSDAPIGEDADASVTDASVTDAPTSDESEPDFPR